MSTSHRRADGPLAFSVIDLARRPGSQRVESRSVPAPTVLGTDLIGVPQGADVELQASFESVSEGIWVSGSATAQAVGECGRCLEKVTLDVTAPLQALYLYPGESREHDDAEEDQGEDVFEFDGEAIDLEQLLRDAVAEQLPFTPLCDPNCPGLCDQCGARLADDPGHAHEVIDPRWAALESLSEKKES